MIDVGCRSVCGGPDRGEILGRRGRGLGGTKLSSVSFTWP